jgi:serine/threonine protein kinase
MQAMFVAGTEGYPNPIEKTRTFSPTFFSFISLCLEREPNKRPMATELLRHEFVANSNCESPEVMKQVVSGIFVLTAVLPF